MSRSVKAARGAATAVRGAATKVKKAAKPARGAKAGVAKAGVAKARKAGVAKEGAAKPPTRAPRRRNIVIDEADEALELAGLPGLLRRPADATALYVMAHGAGAGMRHEFMRAMAAELAARGVATVRWEFPYMAAGKPRPDRAEVAEAAVRAVWEAVRERVGDLPLYAGGKSFGGRMTSRAHAAQALAGARGLIFLGFPLHPPEKPGSERAEHLSAAAGPLLFLQGDRDELAELALLQPVVGGLGARASLRVIEHADHGFDVLVRSGRTRSEVLGEVADAIAAWIAANAG